MFKSEVKCNNEDPFRPEISCRHVVPVNFRTPALLHDHFQDHGHEFGYASVDEYLAACRELFDAPLSPTIHQGVRPKGNVVRYDSVRDQFGVMHRDGYFITMYRPNPHHGMTKRDYFEYQCRRDDG